MKKTTKTEYKTMDLKSIEVKLKGLKKEIADSKLEKAMGKLKDVKTIEKLRRQLAVLSTIRVQKIAIEKGETK